MSDKLPEFVRAEDHLEIPIGHPVEYVDREAHRCDWYVFVGWRPTTVGKEAVFVRTYSGKWLYSQGPVWQYHASGLETLLLRFPALHKCLLRKIL